MAESVSLAPEPSRVHVGWWRRRQLRKRYEAVKAHNDRIFWHAYELSRGVSALHGRGAKGRLRFALDALKTTATYDEERELWRLLYG